MSISKKVDESILFRYSSWRLYQSNEDEFFIQVSIVNKLFSNYNSTSE